MSKKFRAEDARQILQNAAFQQALQRVQDHVDARLLACKDPDEFYRAGVAKQVTVGVVRELQRIIATDEAEQIELEEIERMREPFKVRKFQR